MRSEKTNVERPKGNPLGYEKIYKLLLSLAWPTILGNIINSLYNIVDQIFIGHSVGYLGNAATNISFPIFIIILAFGVLTGIGTATNFSVELGRNNPDKAKKVVGTAIGIIFIVGVILIIIFNVFLTPLMYAFGATNETITYATDYTRIISFGTPLLMFSIAMGPILRSDGNSTYPLYCVIAGVVLKIILNIIFIFHYHWGIKAIATGTVISQILAAIMLILYIPRFKNIKISFKDFLPKWSAIKIIFALGMSPFIFQISATFIQIVINNSLKSYGASCIYGSDIPIAIAGIVSKINIIFISIIIGLVQGSQPIIGYNYGAKNYARVRQTFNVLIKITTSISIIAFLIFEIFPSQVISIFGESDKTYFEFGTIYARIFLFSSIFAGILISGSTFFTSIQKPKIGVMLSLLKQIIFLLPLIIFLPMLIGIKGIVYATPIADTIVLIPTIIMLRRQFKKIPKENIPRYTWYILFSLLFRL